jgi:PiT family inorganic phosphate transporter
VNGGNDVAKGVATLAGAGVTRFRTAIAWGTITTLAGCIVSLALAERMTKLFTSGIVAAPPTANFTISVLAGATTWVGLATVLRLPVSTTHSIVGALVGAGVVYQMDAVAWNSLIQRVVVPLLLSVVVAYLLSAALSRLLNRRSVAVASTRPPQQRLLVLEADLRPGDGGFTVCDDETCPAEACNDQTCPPVGPPAADGAVTMAHWVTSGLTGFARGLNDAPKIVAIGAVALVPATLTLHQVLAAVAAAMAVGSVVAGIRVARRLSCDVVRMTHHEGFTANLSTAVLVGIGAGYGLPMSTTQVSVGAIAGLARTNLDRLNSRTLRDFAVAWLITPPFAATVAGVTLAVLT